MLIWMCALKCEAKPLIDYYRLKKNPGTRDYHLYQGDDMACIVSGIGSENMANAVAWAVELTRDTTPQIWINLGIAGHQNLDVGCLVRARSFSHVEHEQILKGGQQLPTSIPAIPLISVTRPQLHYPPQAMIDMEGWSFALNIQTHAPTLWWQSLKVISDNSTNHPTRDKSTISKLITERMTEIDSFARALVHRANLKYE